MSDNDFKDLNINNSNVNFGGNNVKQKINNVKKNKNELFYEDLVQSIFLSEELNSNEKFNLVKNLHKEIGTEDIKSKKIEKNVIDDFIKNNSDYVTFIGTILTSIGFF